MPEILDRPLEDLAEQQGVELNEGAVFEAEKKYLALKTKIENLGPVNPDALTEFEDAQQWYDFLNAQRQDLLDSTRDTEKAIQEAMWSRRSGFLAALNEVNETFKTGYVKPFGGGSAEMRLTDEANSNEPGIDIAASPRASGCKVCCCCRAGRRRLRRCRC